jgi:hypothetical protein
LVEASHYTPEGRGFADSTGPAVKGVCLWQLNHWDRGLEVRKEYKRIQNNPAVNMAVCVLSVLYSKCERQKPEQ